VWAGGSLVPQALSTVRPGGTVVCAGIHMSAIPSFSYNILWREKVLRSVANLTIKDGEEFFCIAPEVPVRTETTTFPCMRQTKRSKVSAKTGSKALPYS
jgi:propanol-preferring alcohol dehydrogenase